jgi:hypothetical protein
MSHRRGRSAFPRGVMAVFSDRIDCVRDCSEIFLPALSDAATVEEFRGWRCFAAYARGSSQ